jgi:radical SAM superfamily enzyme YgiQ (UPF0313 family)
MKNDDNVTIYFADLTHTGQGINADTMPLGVGLIASNIKKNINNIDLEIFKLPNALNDSIDRKHPQIVCFSNYSWNELLTLEYAKYLKKKDPSTIIILGGPNFPLDKVERKEYLQRYPEIDFYIKWDGEIAATELVSKLLKFNLNVSKLKATKLISDNLCYLDMNNEYIEGRDARVDDIDSMPSPYTDGLFDHLLKTDFVPLIETVRGCPYSCTFCNDGDTHRSKLGRRSTKKVELDFEYTAKIAAKRALWLSDLNFGMYKEDIDTAHSIAKLIKKYDWPDRFETSTGKAQPARLIESNEIINSVKPGVFKLGYSFQSTDDGVLKDIKRKNISVENLQGMTDYFRKDDSEKLEFFTELILALPNDTLEKFTSSLRDVTDKLLTNNIDVHQLTLLKGSNMAEKSQRELYGLNPKFRVLTGCFGEYFFGEKKRAVFEIEEVILENKTFPPEDYEKARILHLLVKIYVDHDPFIELMTFLRMKNISLIDLMIELRDKIIPKSAEFSKLISNFTEAMTDNVFDTEEELMLFLAKDDALEKYLSSEYGVNELLFNRANAFVSFNDVIHDCLLEATLNILKSLNLLTDLNFSYVSESINFSKLKKFDINNLYGVKKGFFTFDFLKAQKNNYKLDPTLITKDRTEYVFKYENTDIDKIKLIIGNEDLSMKRIGKLYQRHNMMEVNRGFDA